MLLHLIVNSIFVLVALTFLVIRTNQKYIRQFCFLIYFYAIAQVVNSGMALAGLATFTFDILYLPLDFLAIGLIFWAYLENPKFKKYVFVITLLIFLMTLVDFRLGESNRPFLTISSGVQAILVAGISLYTFHKMLNKGESLSFSQLPIFWINIGILIYAAGSLVIFLTLEDVIKIDRSGRLFRILLGYFHTSILILKYVIFAIAIIVAYKRQRQNKISNE